MATQRTFTVPYIKGLKPKAKPYKEAEKAAKGEGRLLIRVRPNGSKEFFYRYRSNDQDKTLALGRYDPAGTNGRTLAGIRKALRERRELQRETGDVKLHLETQQRREALEARKGSFEQLLNAYADSLEAAGKTSAKEARGIFKRHVIKPFPLLAKSKANEIKPGDIQTILARMVRAGITRQVNKARAYLRAAFAYGGKADNDPRTVAKDGVLFGITANPVLLVPIIKEYERTGDRVLEDAELREYWKALDELPIAQRATLRLNLALACQRPTQLVRAGWQDFDFAERTITIRDSKGRGVTRDHLVPLTDFALQQLKPLRQLNERPAKQGEEAPLPFSSFGPRPLAVETLSVAVREVSKRLKRTHKIPTFRQGDLRRTAETMMQKLGIAREVRAHLLSHGRSAGVQGKHYERYDYLTEKRTALEKWAAHLERIIEGKSAKVIGLKGRAA
jgi:integrase